MANLSLIDRKPQMIKKKLKKETKESLAKAVEGKKAEDKKKGRSASEVRKAMYGSKE